MVVHERGDGARPGFWAGYRLWLLWHAPRLVAITLAVVALFVAALWISSAPQDPFTYDTF